MSHKVHPKAHRLKALADWNSRWLNKKNIPKYLEEDFKIRSFINNKFEKLGVEKVEIERFSGKITIIISSARPGLIIGRGGEGIEELRKGLVREILNINKESLTGQKEKRELKIEIREIKDPWSSASLSAQWIAQQIEKRVPRRKVLKQVLEKIMASKSNKGARVEVAGRLDGVSIARREWLKKGKLPRQTIRADIDYAQTEARCTYGVIGVRVWIYKGEKFE